MIDSFMSERIKNKASRDEKFSGNILKEVEGHMLVCEKKEQYVNIQRKNVESKKNSCMLRQNYYFPFEEKQENQCDNWRKTVVSDRKYCTIRVNQGCIRQYFFSHGTWYEVRIYAKKMKNLMEVFQKKWHDQTHALKIKWPG